MPLNVAQVTGRPDDSFPGGLLRFNRRADIFKRPPDLGPLLNIPLLLPKRQYGRYSWISGLQDARDQPCAVGGARAGKRNTPSG